MTDYPGEPDHCGGADVLCTCLCGKPYTMTDEEFQAKERGRQCDGCAVMVEIEKMELEPVCRCAETKLKGGELAKCEVCRDAEKRKCESCGGNGFFKGARLGDEPCQACSGTGKV